MFDARDADMQSDKMHSVSFLKRSHIVPGFYIPDSI